MKNSFHGRTLATMSATGKAAFQPMFEPKVPGFIHIPHNDINALKTECDDSVCAVFLELVQGEGGVYPVDNEYIQACRDICSETQTLLIVDEVQTCFGRTGTLFAYQGYDIEPDIMTCGKGIGSGYPLSAMLCKKELNIFDAGEQGGTYGTATGNGCGLSCTK